MRSSLAIVTPLAVALLLGGCATEEPGIAPARDGFYFPVALALDPARPLLYVANANADLLYNGGTLNVLDVWKLPEDLRDIKSCLETAAQPAASCPARLDCSPARTDATSWECAEGQLIQASATLRTGDFPSMLGVTADGTRIFAPIRGQDYLLWADIVALTGTGKHAVDLRCNDDRETGCGGLGSAKDCAACDCDAEHRVGYSEDLRESMPGEPFGLLVNELVATYVGADGVRRTCKDALVPAVPCDCQGAAVCQGELDVDCCEEPPTSESTHVYLAHLSGGEVSFLTSGPSGVTLRDIRGGFFQASSTTGIRGGFALAARTPGDPRGRVYVSSRVASEVAAFVIRDNRYIVDESRVSMGTLFPGDDSRGIAFGPGGDRMYVVSRQPPSLVAFDMSTEDGLPRAEPLWVEEVCSEPSLLRLVPERSLAYVVCFGTEQIFVLDTDSGKVVDQITTGKGPNELVIDVARQRAYVANFLENTVGVIDLDPSHETYHRMLVRIGLLKKLAKN